MRIVCLLPGATELICELGLGDSLVGISHECDFPETVTNLPRVTRSLLPNAADSRELDRLVSQRTHTQMPLYQLDHEALIALQPDLIVTQSLCDVCAVAEQDVQQALRRLPYRPKVVTLEPTDFRQVLGGLQELADAIGESTQGVRALKGLQQRLEDIAARTALAQTQPTVVFLEWLDPPFSAGHWTPEIVRLAGGRELLGVAADRSRRIAWSDVILANPEVIAVACCGYGIPQALADWQLQSRLHGLDELLAVRQQRVFFFDGNAYFNRPGPRLVASLEWLAYALHPQLHSRPEGVGPAMVQLVD
jgi:iron complex transport system substrate-binding protein